MSPSGAHGRITTIGEILVEMMSEEPGVGWEERQRIHGPYPSGAPAIFIDQVARLGIPAAIVGAVGDDAFGRVNTERLARDGVDIGTVGVSRERPTAIAFVRYRPDGNRDFLFTLVGSAAGEIDADDASRQLAGTDHLHVVGSSLTMPAVAAYVREAVPIVKSGGGTVSFDPNVRPEIMRDDVVRERLEAVLAASDTVLPSAGELPFLCDAPDDDAAIARLLERGVPEIVLKRGADGASRYTAQGVIHHPAYVVDEVDPTGAGDGFGATYVGCRRLGHTPESALERACAAGAMAVRVRGPMEGTAPLDAIETFVRATPTR